MGRRGISSVYLKQVFLPTLEFEGKYGKSQSLDNFLVSETAVIVQCVDDQWSASMATVVPGNAASSSLAAQAAHRSTLMMTTCQMGLQVE